MRKQVSAAICGLGLAALAWLWWSGQSAVPSADDARDDLTRGSELTTTRKPEGTPSRALVSERAEVRAPASRDAAASAPAPVAPEVALASQQGRQQGRQQGMIEVEVHDRVMGTPLREFRYVLTGPGIPRRDQRIESGSAQIAVPLDMPLTLRIEADGFEPAPPEQLTLHAGERLRKLRIALERARALAGIVLQVVDAREAPIPHVIVEARAHDLATPERLPEPLWVRQSADPEGRYPLPELQPGTYHLTVRACTEAGDPETHQSHAVVVTFRGGEQLPLRVQLPAGALITLEVTDAVGKPLGLEVNARLVRDQQPLPTRWLARVGEQHVARRNALPGPAPATLESGVAGGAYVLEVQGLGITKRVALQLETGSRVPVRVVLE